MTRRRQKTGLQVAVLVLNKKGQVLLGWHTAAKRQGWGFPGGEAELGEDIFETAKRELSSKTGIKAKKLKIVSVSSDKVGGELWVTLGLLCKDYEGNPQVLEPKKINRWEWFPLNKLPRPSFAPARKIIENYKAGRLYKVKL